MKDIKFCTDCKHCDFMHGKYTCMRKTYTEYDLVTGEPSIGGWTACFEERRGSYQDSCDSVGRYFEPKSDD